METIFGNATYVRRTATVQGNQEGIATLQVATFRIGSRAIEVALPEAPQIDEGDEVAVAGDLKNGTLHARAYMNRSNGAYNRRKGASNSLAAVGIAMVFGFVPGFGIIFLALLPFALAWCVWDLAQFRKNRRALRLVREYARTRPRFSGV